MDASGSGSDASDEQWDSPAEHGETSSSEECSSEADEPCSDEEAEKVAALRYLHAPSVSEVFKKRPGRKRGVKPEPCATATGTEVARTRPQRARKATEQFVAAGEGGLVYILFQGRRSRAMRVGREGQAELYREIARARASLQWGHGMKWCHVKNSIRGRLNGALARLDERLRWSFPQVRLRGAHMAARRCRETMRA